MTGFPCPDAGEIVVEGKRVHPSRRILTAGLAAINRSRYCPRAMPSSVAAAAPAIGRYRWVICALLFFGTTINYVDRQVLGILARDLQREIGWTELQYGNIVAAFSAAYAIGLLLAGRLMDRFGVRTGYAVALTLWSIAGMVTALAGRRMQFGFCRALWAGRSGQLPAAIKGVAEGGFRRKRRALATGIFNAGMRMSAPSWRR